MFRAQKNNTDRQNSFLEVLDISYSNPHRFENLINFNFPKKAKLAFVIKFTEQNLVATYTERMNILRFLAICSIVWGHSLGTLESTVFTNTLFQFLQMALIELGKMGTVIFFLISGFFLADKIHKFNVVSYLRYRLFTVIVPWLSYLILFVIIQMLHILSFDQFTGQSFFTTLALFLNLFKIFIVHAAYWFIPVAMLSACLLILFKKHLNKPWFILILLAITAFYSINLYHGWISSNHTKAFLAYVFFMWLGVQLKYRIQKIRDIAESVSWSIVLPLLAVLFVAACLEGAYLRNIASEDPYASIRLSNWLLSIVVFFAYLKSNVMSWINSLKPQCYVYGVYLIHSIVMTELVPLMNRIVLQNNTLDFFQSW